MTIIIASKYKDSTYIGCDSAVTAGWERIPNLKDFTKIVTYPSFSVGICGSPTMLSILKKHLSDKTFLANEFMEMRDTYDALSFAEVVFPALLELAEKRLARESSSGAELENTNLLIASKTGIFSVDDYLNVSEHEKFYMIGCGYNLALGAMEAIYPSIKNKAMLKQGVETALNIACKNSVGCGLPISMVEV